MKTNIARKHHSKKRSKKNLDALYELLAPGSIVQKTDQNTQVIREPGKLDVTVLYSDIAKFGSRDERKTMLQDYINRRGPLENSTEAKILTIRKEFTRIQKGDRKTKHRKRDTASGVSSTKSNIANTMRVCMPKVPTNLASQVPVIQAPANLAPQDAAAQAPANIALQGIVAQTLITAPPSNTTQELPPTALELQLSSTSAPREAL